MGTSIPMHIVEDNAFHDDNFIMKPFSGASSASDETKQRFNKMQMAVRKDCECGWGLIVKRFPVFAHKIPFLGRGTEGVERSATLIAAAFLLHNLCIRMDCDADADMLQYDAWGRVVQVSAPLVALPVPSGGSQIAAGSKMDTARKIISVYNM